MFIAALAAGVPAVLVYLELPLAAARPASRRWSTAGPTWDGFKYIALAEQFRGVLSNPFAGSRGRWPTWPSSRRQLGPLAFLAAGFLVTAVRAARGTLLTGSAVLITLLFNQAYANADIERYYLGRC